MDLIEGCPPSLHLEDTMKGDVECCVEWVSVFGLVPLAPTPAVDPDLEAICFLTTSLYCLLSSVPWIAYVALAMSSRVVWLQGPTSCPTICARWYFNLLIPPVILFPYRLQVRICRLSWSTGVPHSQNGSKTFDILYMDKMKLDTLNFELEVWT